MTDKLRQAIEQVVAILGPEAPLCSGCVDEWTEALRILRAALAEQVPVADDQIRRIYDGATHAAAMAVFMTRMDSEQPDADDKGVSGWLQEAEERIKLRASQTLSELVTTPQPPKPSCARKTEEPND